MNTNENIIKKLKYLGLDLDNIPKIISNFEPLDYRPLKYNDEHIYKVYKYVNINDIQILLTPTNRLCGINEKYKKAVPLYEYLNGNKEENIERHTKFLSMVESMETYKVEEIEKIQKQLNKDVPFKIKYPKDYLWQIYYSEYTNKYFMLVTTEDLEYSAFFYLLKKQLENKNEKIFVPISYTDYTREYLNRTQISDIENYLWLFTKEWPLVYEVFDKEGNLSVHISGKVYVYDDIKSDYKIKLRDKEQAVKFYKLLKALFIMQTEAPHNYNFSLSVDEKGSIEFSLNNKKIIYEILPSLIKEEYLKAEEKKIKLAEEKVELEKELDVLQKKSNKLEKEYIEKEKQISTFLECRKTVLGRVKYFFKYKKVSLIKQEETEKKQDIKLVRINKYGEVKSNYTLEELIELCKQIDKEDIKVKNLQADIKAINQRVDNLDKKVKNAVLYIEEIDKHKKSIFDFWRFTNKDKQAELPAGEMQENKVESIKKVFDYNLDFEDLAKQLDSAQRELLDKKQLDSIFLATTDILGDINKVAKKEEITEERLEQLKNRALEENTLLEKESFDIFGSISYDNKLKILANQKHRESERETFKILDINKNTTIQEYTEFIEEVIKNINSSFDKIKVSVDMSVYKCDTKDIIESQYNVFNITATKAIENILKQKDKDINLYKVKINAGTNIIPFTNSVFFDNSNKTLPLGMNVKEEILLNNEVTTIQKEFDKKANIVCYEEENNQISKIYIKEIKIKEYKII